ncbi:uncharacterized protein isoform X3 [Rhodnius prolixus]|uniref:uncharacterized protein isoform X3 n=1 Tax=Rhodnius prolixus TaxID=13249 RepID=UPI003D189BB7
MRDSYRWGTTRASSFQNVPSRYQMYCPSYRTASASVYSGLAVVSFQGSFFAQTHKNILLHQVQLFLEVLTNIWSNGYFKVTFI